MRSATVTALVNSLKATRLEPVAVMTTLPPVMLAVTLVMPSIAVTRAPMVV